MPRPHLMPLMFGVVLCVTSSTCGQKANLHDRIIAANTSKYCLPDACFNPHVLAVETGYDVTTFLGCPTGLPFHGASGSSSAGRMRNVKAKRNVGGRPDCSLSPRAYTQAGAAMERNEMCICGHPQRLHRNYGCTGSRFNPDPKRTERRWCLCRGFLAQKVAHAASRH
jgi:hypothetical protein